MHKLSVTVKFLSDDDVKAVKTVEYTFSRSKIVWFLVLFKYHSVKFLFPYFSLTKFYHLCFNKLKKDIWDTALSINKSLDMLILWQSQERKVTILTTLSTIFYWMLIKVSTLKTYFIFTTSTMLIKC